MPLKTSPFKLFWSGVGFTDCELRQEGPRQQYWLQCQWWQWGEGARVRVFVCLFCSSGCLFWWGMTVGLVACFAVALRCAGRVKTQGAKTSENFSEESNLPRRFREDIEKNCVRKNTIKSREKVISSIFWEIFWNIFCEHFSSAKFSKFLPFAFLPFGSLRGWVWSSLILLLGVLSQRLNCEMKPPFSRF